LNSVADVAINRVSSVKFLGVVIRVDEHLTWHDHIKSGKDQGNQNDWNY